MSIVGRVACSVRRRGDSGVTLTEVLVALTLLTGLGLPSQMKPYIKDVKDLHGSF